MDLSTYLLEYIRRRDQYERVLPWLDPKLFEEDGPRLVYQAIQRAHQVNPTKIVDYPQISALSREISKDPDDWDEAASTCKRMAKVRAKRKSVERYSYIFLQQASAQRFIQEALNRKEGIDVSRLKSSLSQLETIGNSDGISHDVYNDPSARVDTVLYGGKPVPTSVGLLTDILDGGPCAGEVYTIIALPDGGKTLALIDQAATASEHGFPVFYAACERGRVCLSRFDCRLVRRSAKWIADNPDDFVKRYQRIAKVNAPIRVVDYSRREISTSDLRRDIGSFCDVYGEVGLVVVDYGDLLKSTRRYESPRHELDLVWKELGRMAQEFGCPVWTATQSNRKGASVSTIDMSHVAEAWSKMATTDGVITINASEKEKEKHIARWYVAKTKKTGGSQKIRVTMDPLLCRVSLLGEKSNEQQASTEEASRDSGEDSNKPKRYVDPYSGSEKRHRRGTCQEHRYRLPESV